MADFESRLLPFPHRPSPPSLDSSAASAPAQQSVLAEAELRVDIVRDLLQQLGGPDGFYSHDARLKMTVYAADALLDEMVVLYRRAIAGTATG